MSQPLFQPLFQRIGAGLLGIPAAPALVLGGVVAMSSTALVMKLLTDAGQVDAPHGQLALSVLLFQDLAIVPVLLAVPLLAAGHAADTSALLLAVAWCHPTDPRLEAIAEQLVAIERECAALGYASRAAGWLLGALPGKTW